MHRRYIWLHSGGSTRGSCLLTACLQSFGATHANRLQVASRFGGLVASGWKEFLPEGTLGHLVTIKNLSKDSIMVNQIFINTPRWVWILLMALIWLGISQSFTRTISIKRVTLMPLVMTGLSLFGTLAAFGAQPLALVAWFLAATLSAWLVMQRPLPETTRYDPLARRISLPGSWIPLVLILGIFMTKYVVGVTGALQPALIHDLGFSLGFSALYGAFSGIFLGRAASLLRLAHQVSGLPKASNKLWTA